MRNFNGAFFPDFFFLAFLVEGDEELMKMAEDDEYLMKILDFYFLFTFVSENC